MAPATAAALGLENPSKITKEISKSAGLISQTEARFLVDAYYIMQKDRIRTENQVRAFDDGRPAVLGWLGDNAALMERQLVKPLHEYSQASAVGRWAESITGIGSVISAGLLAHIDITKAPTVGHIWRFAGLDPTAVWKKGEKRPHNAALKTLCWKIGDSFLKTSGRDSDVYGHILIERKAWETAKNENGDYKEQALAIAERCPTHKQVKMYKAGVLPAGHILSRARRYSTKLFLSHWHAVAYEVHFGEKPPKPYVVEHLGHAHIISPPNWEGV